MMQKHTHSHTHEWHPYMEIPSNVNKKSNMVAKMGFYFKYRKQTEKSTNKAENGRAPTALVFTTGFLSAGFLAASDTFLAVKGTPYLQAGLVIF